MFIYLILLYILLYSYTIYDILISNFKYMNNFEELTLFQSFTYFKDIRAVISCYEKRTKLKLTILNSTKLANLKEIPFKFNQSNIHKLEYSQITFGCKRISKFTVRISNNKKIGCPFRLSLKSSSSSI